MSSKLLFSLVALLFSFLVIATGLALLFFPDLGLFIQAYASRVGTVLVLLGLFLLLAFTKIEPSSYLRLKMGGAHLLKVDHGVIEQLVTSKLNVPCQAKVHRKGTIEILVDLPDLSKKRLRKIEEDLSLLFVQELGYPKEFILNVSPKVT